MNLTTEQLLSKVGSNLIKHAIKYFPARLIPALLGIINVAIFTRIFKPSEYGQYILVITTTSILTTILSQWIQQSTLRFLPQFSMENRFDEFNKNLNSILLITIVAFVILSLILYVFLNNILGTYKRFYFPSVVLIVLGILFNNFTTVFQASLRPQKYTKYNIILAVLNSLFSVSLVLFIARDVLCLIWGVILSYIILCGSLFKELRCLKMVTDFNFEISWFKKFASYGFPMVGWFLSSQVLNLSDRYMIEIFRGSAEVGIYSASYNLVNRSIGLLSGPLLIAAHPLIMNAWESYDKNKIRDIISLFSRYFLLIAIPITVYTIIFSRELVLIFLGNCYHEGYKIIPFVMLGFLVYNFSMYGHKGFEIVKKTGIMLKLLVISAFTNVVLNFIFIPLYGYMAAAATTFVSFLLYCVLIYWKSASYLKWIIPWKSLFKIIISALVPGVFLWMLKFFFGLNNFLFILIGFSVYICLYFIMLWLNGKLKNMKYLKILINKNL